MDMQNVKNLTIPEGDVKTIHDKDSRLLWGAVGYDTKYAGDTFQQTYSGKNLFYGADSLNGGITSTWSGSSVSLSGTSANTWANITAVLDRPLPAGTYTFSIGKSTDLFRVNIRINYDGSNHDIRIVKNTTSVTFTVPEGAVIRLCYIDQMTTGTILSEKYDFQLEQGSTATSYEPYVGGTASPNPDYPQDVNVVKGKQTVQVTGKNLFDLDTAVTQWESPQGTVYTSPAYVDGVVTVSWTVGANGRRLMAGFKPNLVAGTTYTLSAEVFLSGTNANSYVSMGSISSWGNIDVGEKDKWLIISKTFVATAEDVSDSRMLIQAANTGNTLKFKNVQLEQGSATTYEPYQGASYTVDLGSIELCKIGTYQDYIYKSGDDWYVHKAIGEIVLNGSETWTATSMTNNWLYYTTNAGMAVVTSSQMPNIISNYFSVATTDGQWTSIAGSKSVTLNNTASPNTQIRFTVGDSTNKLADFKTWLSTHNTNVYYALATPTDTKITDNTLTTQLNAIHQWLTRYGYQASVTGNLPMIIRQDALT